MTRSVPSTSPRFADRLQITRAGYADVYMLPMPVHDVVSFRGSFRAYPDFAVHEEVVQNVLVALLDKGTRTMDQYVVADRLENMGAQLSFSTDGFLVEFSGRALRKDVPEVLQLLAMQLREPALADEQFVVAHARTMASVQRSMEQTGSLATGALSRRLFDTSHPNHIPTPTTELATLQELTPEMVRAYHASHFGATNLNIVLVGDLSPQTYTDALESTFGDWIPTNSTPAYTAQATPEEPGRVVIPLADKQNIDVRLGHALTMRRNDPDYRALYLATFILGGNFSSRLMDVVRDQMGLTYGISATLAGMTPDFDGSFRVAVTLSQQNIERGIEATRSEIVRFVRDGILAAELQEKQTTINGAFQVNLATTGGLASALLANAERGFEIDYLDRFVDEVNAVTLDDVHRVIADQFHPDQLHVALAGTVPEAK